MRFLFTLIAGSLVALQVRAQSFFPQTEDIPQMPGLSQVEEVANFDSPQERLLILTAMSTKSISETEKYYHQTLKNLGWKAVQKNLYKRQNDSLQLDLSAPKGKTFIQFTLTQRNDSAN